MPRSIGIFLFELVEVLDFAGPLEVFTTATRVKERLTPDAPKLFEVFTVGAALGLIKARGNLLVQPTYQIGNCPPIDVLIVPGGMVDAELERADVIDWIRQISAHAAITASVCTGAFLLGKAGLLDGKPATTHWEDTGLMQRLFPQVDVRPDSRWVEAGKIVTAAGISAGIDMSLHLVERLEDRQLALHTARQMEYDWINDGKESL